MSLSGNRLVFIVHLALATMLCLWFLPGELSHHQGKDDIPKYTLETMTLSGYRNSTAVAVNASGAVIGYSWEDDSYSAAQPWLWKDGHIHRLAMPSNVRKAYPSSINSRGDIVGTGYRKDGYGVGILWHGQQMMVTDRTSDNFSVRFRAINDRGQIVGNEYAGRENSETEAVLWEKDNEVLLGRWNSADINENGVVAGTHYDGSFVNWSHALICTPGKDTDVLPIPDEYDFADANAINAKKQVVGDLEDARPHAALWDQGKAQVLISFHSQAFDINDAGQIVGSMRPQHDKDTAFIWQKGKLIRLQDVLPSNAACTLTSANRINAFGAIAGSALLDGKNIGFLLTPRAK